jgi:hypothetical protein
MNTAPPQSADESAQPDDFPGRWEDMINVQGSEWRLIRSPWLKTWPAELEVRTSDPDMGTQDSTPARTASVTWQEMRSRAAAFVIEWKGETRERAEKDSFWTDFLNIFGVSRRRVGVFEAVARKQSTGHKGFMDMLWAGHIAVEHKSKGESLDAAMDQLIDYLPSLSEADLPVLAVVCDFATFRVHDLEKRHSVEFALDELPKHLELFAFLAGYSTRRQYEKEQDVNLRATRLLAHLHDTLKVSGYEGHELRVFMVRLLFVLFADDTRVWERGLFDDYIRTKTNPDGRDVGSAIALLFEQLNRPKDKRQKNLDDDLREHFEYINGSLFKEPLPTPAFDRKMRDELLMCSRFDWSAISPAIFGSLFQDVMLPIERRTLGAHYTTEANILRVIRPLFLNELEAELTAASSVPLLRKFQVKLGSLTFFDPACGCGNFLVIAYRELRRLETECLKRLQNKNRKDKETRELNVRWKSVVHVGQFYGIEIEEFPARIAETAMYLMDHLAFLELSAAVGDYYVHYPITDTPHIHIDNALQLDWNTVLPAKQCNVVFGNPPFVGKKEQTAQQKKELLSALVDDAGNTIRGAGVLDYVSGWYVVAAKYIASAKTQVAFVSTSSITQGEQPGVLFRELFRRGIKIHFAHRTFQWQSEAQGKAHVHCVIIGFSVVERAGQPTLYEYDDPAGEPRSTRVKQINEYLIDSDPVLLRDRGLPLNDITPAVTYGSFALDDGQYTIKSREERDAILAESPDAEKYLRPFIGSEELLHGKERWCLWLVDALPEDLRKNTAIRERVRAVQEWRSRSSRKATKSLAATPARFAEMRQPITRYLAVPTLSSEARRYIPIAYLGPEVIASNQVYVVANASAWHFGILTSMMHMAWVQVVCGRLESRYRYSASIVYNNYPWPEPTDKARVDVEVCAQSVLDARSSHSTSTLAALYDPLAMPEKLMKAHAALDAAVDRCYRKVKFQSNRERVEHLFSMYAATQTSLLDQLSRDEDE